MYNKDPEIFIKENSHTSLATVQVMINLNLSSKHILKTHDEIILHSTCILLYA